MVARVSRVRWGFVAQWLGIAIFCALGWYWSLRAWIAFVKWCVRQP